MRLTSKFNTTFFVTLGFVLAALSLIHAFMTARSYSYIEDLKSNLNKKNERILELEVEISRLRNENYILKSSNKETSRCQE